MKKFALALAGALIVLLSVSPDTSHQVHIHALHSNIDWD